MDIKLDNTEDLVQVAEDALLRKGYIAKRTSAYQIKVGSWNFWPEKGTITRDGQRGRHPEKGLDALLKLLANDLSLQRR